LRLAKVGKEKINKNADRIDLISLDLFVKHEALAAGNCVLCDKRNISHSKKKKRKEKKRKEKKRKEKKRKEKKRRKRLYLGSRGGADVVRDQLEVAGCQE